MMRYFSNKLFFPGLVFSLFFKDIFSLSPSQTLFLISASLEWLDTRCQPFSIFFIIMIQFQTSGEPALYWVFLSFFLLTADLDQIYEPIFYKCKIALI